MKYLYFLLLILCISACNCHSECHKEQVVLSGSGVSNNQIYDIFTDRDGRAYNIYERTGLPIGTDTTIFICY